jgi:hypothetical protein
MQYNREQDTFYFAGKTNYIEGKDDNFEYEVYINWTCEQNKY